MGTAKWRLQVHSVISAQADATKRATDPTIENNKSQSARFIVGLYQC